MRLMVARFLRCSRFCTAFWGAQSLPEIVAPCSVQQMMAVFGAFADFLGQLVNAEAAFF